MPYHSQMAALAADTELLFGCVCTEAGGRQRSAIYRDLFRSGLFMSGDVMNLSGFNMAAGLVFFFFGHVSAWCCSSLGQATKHTHHR